MKDRSEIDRLGPWFHNLHLPDGRQTFPDHPLGDFPAFKWREIAPHIPEDLTGWRVLDIGCNAGYYTFALAKRGATVTGIDVDERYLAQARWAAAQFGLEERTTFRCMQVYDLAHEAGAYDLVLFMGVFYHLRYPMLGLDIVARLVKRLMVFQTLTMPGDEVYADAYLSGVDNMNDRESLRDPGWPKMAFLEHRFAGDPTNWWAPNRAGVEAMLRSAGMKVVARPGDEIYLAEPDPASPSCVSTWNSGEFLAATGQRPAEAKNRAGASSHSDETRSRADASSRSGEPRNGAGKDGPKQEFVRSGEGERR